jgi:hypothetical protein
VVDVKVPSVIPELRRRNVNAWPCGCVDVVMYIFIWPEGFVGVVTLGWKEAGVIGNVELWMCPYMLIHICTHTHF